MRSEGGCDRSEEEMYEMEALLGGCGAEVEIGEVEGERTVQRMETWNERAESGYRSHLVDAKEVTERGCTLTSRAQ